MAGNTKLIGFKAGNKAVLERWGGRTDVELSEASIRILTDAVRDKLPLLPPLLPSGDDFLARFDPGTGRVLIDMSIETAARSHEGWEIEWVDSLKQAVQDHRDFFSKDEPGLQ